MTTAAQQNGRAGDEFSFECTLDYLLSSGITTATSKAALGTIALNGQTTVTSGPLPVGRYKLYAVSGDNTFSIMLAKGPVTTLTTGLTLPGGTITVGSTLAFPATGSFNIWNGTNLDTVAYTGMTATTFTGCTGGTHAFVTGNQIWSASPTITAPTAGNPASTGLCSFRGDEIERVYIDATTTVGSTAVGNLATIWLQSDTAGKTGLVYFSQLTNY